MRVRYGFFRKQKRPASTVMAEAIEPRLLLSTYTVTNLNDAGPGSLRDAVQQANANAGADTVVFASGLGGTLGLTGGPLAISDNLTIAGSGPAVLAIDANHQSRVFQIDYFVTATISGLAINNGTAGSSDPNGGGISAGGPLTIANCSFDGDAAAGSGGAISCATTGFLAVLGSTFTHDQAAVNGGAVDDETDGPDTFENSTFSADHAASGGAVFESSTARFNHVSITGCSAVNGGAIDTFNVGTITIRESTLADNIALSPSPSLSTGNGGAVSFAGDLLVDASTFSNNSAPHGVGGAVSDSGGSSAISMTNSTFSGNSSDSGGALLVAAQRDTLNVANCTFYGNSAVDWGGAIDKYYPYGLQVNCTTIVGNSAGISGSGLYDPGAGTPTLNDSIVAGNHLSGSAAPSDIYGAATGSNNLIGTGGSGGLTNAVNGNIVGVADPHLAPLGNYGGPTQSMPPLAGSPAIDTGSNALALLGGNSLKTDQRGYYRVLNGTVDIGACEFDSIAVIPGDVNQDGTVDFADLLKLAQSYGATNANWTVGDMNGDGRVDFADLLTLAQNYGRSTAPAAAASSFDWLRSAPSSARVNHRLG